MRSKLGAILELLREGYELDPGSIEYLVEEAVAEDESAPVGLVLRQLRAGGLTEVQRLNLGAFASKVSEYPRIRRSLEKSVKRKGRCPPAERGWLIARLDRAQEVPPPAELPFSPHASGSSVLLLSDSVWSIERFPTLFDRIAALGSPNSTIEVKLGAFTYASALALIAEWLLRECAVQRYVLDAPPEMESYLERLGFRRALIDRQVRVSPDFMDWAVGLTRINEDVATEEVTLKIVDIIDTFISPKRQEREAFMS